MNEVRKKALWLSLLGLALGVGVGLMFYLLGNPGGFLAENRPALLLYFAASGLYGAANMGTSAVYDIESWSILRCTFTHFLITVCSSILFFGMMILLDWMNMPSAGVCALICLAFVLVYAMIWLAQYIAYVKKVKKMNAKLREWKSRRKN